MSIPFAGGRAADEFVIEAREHLAAATDALLGLDGAAPADARARLDSLFRAMHSIKGGAALVGCRTIAELTHVLETLLDRVREGRVARSPDLTDSLLAGADLVRSLLDDVAGSNDADVSPMLARLQALQSAPPAATAAAPAAPVTMNLHLVLDAYASRTGRDVLSFFAGLEAAGQVIEPCWQVPDQDLAAGLPHGPFLFTGRLVTPQDPAAVAARLLLAPDEWALAVPPRPAAPAAPPPAPPTPAVPAPPPAAAATPAAAAVEPERPTTVRISVQVLDRLMNLAGELVLVRNQALRLVDAGDPAVRQVVQRLNSVTSDVQQAVMLTRMQPILTLFGRFPRLVRDLSRQLGKPIELTLLGTEVELDKAILESLADPLTHLVRNSCDHGIEPTTERVAAGKPPVGHVTLHARAEGGQIHIEVRDDGQGIDPDRVRQKALEKKLRTASELAAMSDADVLSLILLPGFSTAEKVTELSGRGVGMDVVRTNLEQMGGSLHIESVRGQGTAMHLRLPLTLAIIPCLIVSVGGTRYAIAQKDLEELVSLTAEQARTKVEVTRDQEVYRLRNRLLPLVRLGEVLARPRPFDAATRIEILDARDQAARAGDESQRFSFAVLRAGQQRFGLVVDQFLNTEEVVVKPMHPVLKPLSCFAGATIMGDGQIALILSAEGIARHASLTWGSLADQPAGPTESQRAEKQALILFRYGPVEQFAVPLALVRRIEEFPAARLEKVGAQEFVHLKGQTIRVLRLEDYLPVTPGSPRGSYFLLLPRDARKPVGLLFHEIVDTLSAEVRLDTESYVADGLLGTAVIRDRLTLFLDLFRLVNRAESGPPRTAPAPGPDRPPAPRAAAPRARILLVEDTQFFRQMVKGYLESEGYEVATAVNGVEGLTAVANKHFDLVVSDIEMPELDGWGLARAIRTQLGRQDLPLMALTTLSSDKDRQKARECGFDAYEVKLDRATFLGRVAAVLGRTADAARDQGARHG